MIFNKILNLKDEKSKIVIQNASVSFFIKGINIAVNFLTVPLVLSFLNTTQYGIWLTLTAILGWFSLFDLGFGNGLRNHLTLAIAQKNYDEGKIYISTTYAALSVIFGSLIVLFITINPFINWVAVFNAPTHISHDINNAVVFAMCFLFVQFVVRLINTVLLSFQKSALSDLTNALVQVFILLGLYIIKISHYRSLTAVSIVYSVTPVIIFLFISVILFYSSYSNIRPSITFIKPAYISKLLKLGLSFFLIQIAALVLYASDNFIIAQFFNPAEVTTYNIAFKYFSLSNIFFTIVLVPFWSMTTRAHAEGDLTWIKHSVNKLLLIWGVLAGCGVVQLTVSNLLYRIWTHNSVFVPLSLSMVMLVYFIIMNWGVIFANFLNGVGKIKLQVYFSALGMILNIPLAILFIKVLHFGLISVPLATIFTMICGNTASTMQYNKIVNKNAAGIWNK